MKVAIHNRNLWINYKMKIEEWNDDKIPHLIYKLISIINVIPHYKYIQFHYYYIYIKSVMVYQLNDIQ